ERDIAIVKQVDNFLDGRLELSMIIQKIMADLERFVPGERGGQLAARGGRVPPRLSAADLTQSIRVHSHRHPHRMDAGIELLADLRGRRWRRPCCDIAAGPT